MNSVEMDEVGTQGQDRENQDSQRGTNPPRRDDQKRKQDDPKKDEGRRSEQDAPGKGKR